MTEGNRAESKAENELWLASLFTQAYNKQSGTDYEVKPPQSQVDSVDAYLVSPSGRWPQVDLQITTAAPERDSKHNSLHSRLNEQIERQLDQKSIRGWHVFLFFRRDIMKELSGNLSVKSLADKALPLIEKAVGLAKGKEYEHVVEDSTSPFDEVSLMPHPGFNGVEVNAMGAIEVPNPDSVVGEAIVKKEEKHYADTPSLWLLLRAGVAPHTPERIRNTLNSYGGSLRFAQVWYVYPKSREEADIRKVRQVNNS